MHSSVDSNALGLLRLDGVLGLGHRNADIALVDLDDALEDVDGKAVDAGGRVGVDDHNHRGLAEVLADLVVRYGDILGGEARAGDVPANQVKGLVHLGELLLLALNEVDLEVGVVALAVLVIEHGLE